MDSCESQRQKARDASKKLESEQDMLDAKRSEMHELEVREQVLDFTFLYKNISRLIEATKQ